MLHLSAAVEFVATIVLSNGLHESIESFHDGWLLIVPPPLRAGLEVKWCVWYRKLIVHTVQQIVIFSTDGMRSTVTV